MDNNYNKRCNEIYNALINISSAQSTKNSIKSLTQEEISKILRKGRTCISNYLKDGFKKIDVLDELFEEYENNDDVIRILLMRYQLEEIYSRVVHTNDNDYLKSALTGIGNIYDWQTNPNYTKNQRINFYKYLDNFFVKRNPVNYFFYHLSKRNDEILMSFILDTNKNQVVDFSFSYLDKGYSEDVAKIEKLTEFISKIVPGYTLKGITNPISIDKFAELIVAIKKHEHHSFLYYSHYHDSLEDIYYYLEKNNKEVYNEIKDFSFYDLMRLFKRDKDEKIELKDLLDYFSIDSKNIDRSSYIYLERLMILINKVTLYDFKRSKETEDYIDSQPDGDILRNSKYSDHNYFNRDFKDDMKRINLNIHLMDDNSKNNLQHLFNNVYDNKIEMFSLIEKNTLEHQKKIRRMAEENDIEYVNGIEIECNINSIMGENNLLSGKMLASFLCYGYDLDKMRHLLYHFNLEKENKYKGFLAKLGKDKRINIDLVKIYDNGKFDINSNGIFDRKSIVDYLYGQEIIKNKATGYRIIEELKYDEEIMDLERLSKIASEAGGILVLAHPYDINYGSQSIKLNQIDMMKLVAALSDYKLAGLEIDEGRYSKEEIAYLKYLTKEYKLFNTYGNEYLGDVIDKPMAIYLTKQEEERMLAGYKIARLKK